MNAAQHSVHPTSGSLRIFKHFTQLEVCSVKMALPRPAQPPVTQTVGWMSLFEMLFMLTNRNTLIVRICLLPSILLCILGCVSISNIDLWQSDPNRFPIESMKITMALDHREEFFTQLQNFAD